jgi:hypothetical protein
MNEISALSKISWPEHAVPSSELRALALRETVFPSYFTYFRMLASRELGNFPGVKNWGRLRFRRKIQRITPSVAIV